jgi:Deoxynucleoside kinases
MKLPFSLRIEICGGIASGKTTLAKLLQKNNFKPVLENFNKNPFLEQFYKNPTAYSFETETTFLLQHFNQIKESQKRGSSFICDFSLLLDLAFANVTLNPTERNVFKAVYNEAIRKTKLPNAIIYLKCNPKILLQRIHQRDRSYEVAITKKYLENINKALVLRLKRINKKVKIIIIDSQMYNFNNKKDGDAVVDIIQKELG